MNFCNTNNHVRIAVDRVGGATKACHLLLVSNATVHAWIKHSRVPDIDKAKRLAELSGLEVTQLRSTW